jgi:translation initiation factor 1 (eIF-1/SUI1)
MTIYTREADGNLRYIRPERIVGHILDEEDDTKVTHYIVDPSAPLMQSEDSRRSTFDPSRDPAIGEKKHLVYPVEELVVLRIGDGPYGESVLDTVFTVWKQMTLIEDAIVIYRVVHAPERRIYYIDTGNLQGPKREQAIERQRLKLMQKQVNRNNQMTTDYDPHSTSESIFIPTNSMGKGSRVETLQGGQNLGNLEDLNYFTKKMAAGLRIPSSMIDTQGDQQNQFSDMRVGQVYQVEIRYMGHIKRISRIFARELHKDFVRFCTNREIDVPKTVRLVFNDPSSYAKYKEIEVQQQLLNMASSSTQFPSLSKRFVLEKYLMMDEEEIIRNEEEKLREKGIDPKDIKKMPRQDIDNLVYGDGSVGEKYGLKPPEQGAGGFY